jgi:hypothetical protein
LSNVHAVTPKGDKGAALIVLEDNSQVWTPDIEKAKALKIGEPIPSTWTLKQGEYGPQAFPPREGKGGGFKGRSPELEQFIQERMDRRTALMQAVAVYREHLPSILPFADDLYNWLRSTTSGVAVLSKGAAVTPASSPAASDPSSAPVKRIDQERVSSSEAEQAGAEDRGQVVGGGEASATCPPHSPDPDAAPTKTGRVPCLTCGVWVKGTVA